MIALLYSGVLLANQLSQKRMLALEPAKDSSRELRMRDIVGEGPNVS